MKLSVITFPLLLGAAVAQAAPPLQYAVVPAAYTTTDAISFEWIAGASRDLRQQTLVGESHLTNLIGQNITAIELRRTAANEIYQGGTANMAVTLSTSPNLPLTCSDTFAANIGTDAQPVFQGQVTLPTSPATGAPGTTVPWDPDKIVRIAFQQPFQYLGGTLCVDVTGSRIVGQEANWWMADAMFENIAGSAVEIGHGCGAYGGPQGQWSNVATRTLLPGGYARFWAYGPENSLGFVVFGGPSPAPIPLSLFGIPSPNCFCDLQPGTILAALVVPFVPETNPDVRPRGGIADFRLHLPNVSWILSTQLATQWFELSQMASSNAWSWTVANAAPTLDMALVEGHPSEARGEVSVHLAHVLRLEYQ